MKSIWKLQDAKSRFSKVVQDALKKGPQYVTKRGVEAVVVLSIKDYEALTSTKPSFKEMIMNCPKIDQKFEFTRQRDLPRSIKL
jgi:prevent-host-death family protein